MTYYECDICGFLHPWGWDGDCRDDANRFTEDQLEPDDIVCTMDERVAADMGEQS